MSVFFFPISASWSRAPRLSQQQNRTLPQPLPFLSPSASPCPCSWSDVQPPRCAPGSQLPGGGWSSGPRGGGAALRGTSSLRRRGLCCRPARSVFTSAAASVPSLLRPLRPRAPARPSALRPQSQCGAAAPRPALAMDTNDLFTSCKKGDVSRVR